MKTASSFVPFTADMKKTHTILIPNMLPMHFSMIKQILENYGYSAELLTTSDTARLAETGLKYVHNDTCYPAILVIGQMMDALLSGKYDPHRTALLLFQTGGGCRASNYVSLMRKALLAAGMEYVPVIPLSMAGIEKHPGFKNSVPLFHKMAYGVLYGDLLMSLVNQTKPYEKTRGTAQALADSWTSRLVYEMAHEKLFFRRRKAHYREIIRDFAAIERVERRCVKVGIVGEIYVKFSPLGNNGLESFLAEEGAEVVMPGLCDFFNYCMYNGIMDYKLYGKGRISHLLNAAALKFLCARQREQADAIRGEGTFTPSTPFEVTLSLSKDFIGYGTKMGEGWLLVAEMLELAHSGVKNIVCAQPFGCLPNHICGKGMMKSIKEAIPGANIVAIDYDSGASAVNQENRLKLMLASAYAGLGEA